ncbi:MAG: hypothetical protein AB7U45_04780 [Desulfamplus sp.]
MESCLKEQTEDVTVLPLESETKTITQCSICKTEKADLYYEFDVEEIIKSDTYPYCICKDCFHRMLKNHRTGKPIMDFS